MAEYCADGRYKIYRPPIWMPTGKYRAKSGKFIAIGNTRSLTPPQKAELYNNKASNLLFVDTTGYEVPDVVTILNNPPYNIPKDRMIANMGPPIENLTPLLQAGLKRFNIDEPWHKKAMGFTPEFVAQVDAQLPADGKLYTSEYYSRACWAGWHGEGAHNTVNHLIAEYSPLVSSKTKFGMHSKWEYLDGYGVVTDPRPQWTQLRDQLAGQSKFEHGWVPTLHTSYHIVGWGHYQASLEEMQLIFGHANNVGANTIFIYVEVPGGAYDSGVLDNALRAAYEAGGWVEREEEKVQPVFCCTTPTYDPDSCELFEIQRLGEFRWV
ncbi:MAG: hypothetical protein FJ215_13730 [Ignavibacteria bacterium]|nr:hypothetical protein [Ignavibacteria bacterium]